MTRGFDIVDDVSGGGNVVTLLYEYAFRILTNRIRILNDAGIDSIEVAAGRDVDSVLRSLNLEAIESDATDGYVKAITYSAHCALVD